MYCINNFSKQVNDCQCDNIENVEKYSNDGQCILSSGTGDKCQPILNY
jgi:hypothetical protein